MKPEHGISDLALERYQLGELPDSEMRTIRRRVATDAVLRDRLERLEVSDALLREAYDRDGIGCTIRARVDEFRRRSRPIWRLSSVPAALAAAVLLVMVSVPVIQLLGPSGVMNRGADVRLKGLQPTLSLFCRTDTGSRALSDGDPVRAGDLIRLAYNAADRSHGVIVSVDGRGAVTRHLPEDGVLAARLEPGGTILLAHAFELDAAPRFERFYFVTGEHPFEVEAVVQAAERVVREGSSPEGTRLDLPDGLDQFIVSLSKEDTP